MVRVFVAYLAAVFVAYASAAIAQTQSMLAHLRDMGVSVTLADRFAATGHDLLGMAGLFLPMIAVAFAIALPVAAGVIRLLPRWRPLGYVLAGGIGLLAIHVLLQMAFNITPVSAARTTMGLTVQALCGALGGWVFLLLLPARR
jgi:hypothetical protein